MDDLIETIVPGGWGLALGVGVGVALLMTRSVRPLAKEAIKGYLAVSEGVRRATAGAAEGFQDLYAEAKSEREAGAGPTSPEVSQQ